MPQEISTNKARQGRKGWHVLVILVSALVLVAIVWAGVELYGEWIDSSVVDQSAPEATE